MIAAVGMSLAMAGGGFAVGSTANATPADNSTVTQVSQLHPAQRDCWWEQGRNERVWHDGWWDGQRWHDGWWSWEWRPGGWRCR